MCPATKDFTETIRDAGKHPGACWTNIWTNKEEKLTNDRRNVIVRFKLGMKMEKANKKAGSNIEFDVIIVHAGTNNLHDSTPKDLTETVLNTLDKIEKSNPTARVAYSSIFKRNDNQSLNIKGKKVNELLEALQVWTLSIITSYIAICGKMVSI